MNARRRVGIVATQASWDRYVGEAALKRLSALAEIVWLEFPGSSRTLSPPPADPESMARLAAFVPDLDALIVSHGAPRITAGIMAAAPRLAMIGDTHGDRFAARVDVAAAKRACIAVVDTTNGSSDPVAEWALALILLGLRNAGAHFRRLIEGELLWPDRDVFLKDPGYLNGELTGKTVGLVAVGNIGRRLLELLAPFHVKPLAFDPYAPAALAGVYDLAFTSLDTLMATADVVVCLAPLTGETKGLIGKAQIEAMRPGTVFVNVSRGAVVDSSALVARLQRQDIIAGIDVFDPEPVPVGSVLRSLPNVFLSPHIAGVTAACEPRFFDLMVDEVERVFAGHQPRFPLIPRDP
ncbi:NAD(P)-dependent oxidoreductase [Arthrobacter sp. 35W]|uniref:NAD(P)-dependent oxidoreductase n=1 Tax=Arthrobacter sp. 35W TaxID=1132441 RepID=UPI00040EBDD9|nr:NAD(P)-dependent oxidoreductase [Arthrobacter sp. 35W]